MNNRRWSWIDSPGCLALIFDFRVFTVVSLVTHMVMYFLSHVLILKNVWIKLIKSKNFKFFFLKLSLEWSLCKNVNADYNFELSDLKLFFGWIKIGIIFFKTFWNSPFLILIVGEKHKKYFSKFYISNKRFFCFF